MKSEIYNLLKKDLKELCSKEKKDERPDIIKNIEEMVENIDKIYKVFGDKVTEEDLKIIVANTYVQKLSELAYKKDMQHEKKEIEVLESQIDILHKYFENSEEAEAYSLKTEYSFASIVEVNRIINFVNKDKNGISSAFNICGVILIIFGFIFSIIIGVSTYSFMSFLILLIGVLFSSLTFFGFAELFQILHDIRKKLYLQK
ncbi:MAG: hypothetical protein E7161_02440 [Firmicutes bacterium]|nr:hypothetical protein [Bacillota bacterium]